MRNVYIIKSCIDVYNGNVVSNSSISCKEVEANYVGNVHVEELKKCQEYYNYNYNDS